MKLMKPYLVKYRHGLLSDRVVFADSDEDAAKAGLAEFRFNTYGPDMMPLEHVVESVSEMPGATTSLSRATVQFSEAGTEGLA